MGTERKESTASKVLTAVLVVTAIALVITLILTQRLLRKRQEEEAALAPIVVEFLDHYVGSESAVEKEAFLEQYFSCIDTTSIGYSGESLDALGFAAVFIQPNPKAVSYHICTSRKNYVEFMLQDSEGNDLPPRLGMFYVLNGEGRISSYTLTRLQPVSKADPEWNGAWQ